VHGSVWLWNFVAHITGGTQIQDVWEQGAEENISTKEGRIDGKMGKTV
jgi:hypothetical protein